MHVLLLPVKMVDYVLKIQQHWIVLDVNVQLVTRGKCVTHPSLSYVCKTRISHHLILSYFLCSFQLVGALRDAKMVVSAMLIFVYVPQVIAEHLVK